ncbi:hypothetical protein Hanom_Chr14g01271961 [Helianthus anomalus]
MDLVCNKRQQINHIFSSSHGLLIERNIILLAGKSGGGLPTRVSLNVLLLFFSFFVASQCRPGFYCILPSKKKKAINQQNL